MLWILWWLFAPVVIRHASAKGNISCLVWLSARDMPCGQKALVLWYWRKSPKLVPTCWQLSEECSPGKIIIFCLFAATYLPFWFMCGFCNCNYFILWMLDICLIKLHLVLHHTVFCAAVWFCHTGFPSICMMSTFGAFDFLCGRKRKKWHAIRMVNLKLFPLISVSFFQNKE